MARIVRENKSTVDSRKRRQKSSREEPASEGARYTKTGAGRYAAKSNTAAEFSGCLVMFKKNVLKSDCRREQQKHQCSDPRGLPFFTVSWSPAANSFHEKVDPCQGHAAARNPCKGLPHRLCCRC